MPFAMIIEMEIRSETSDNSDAMTYHHKKEMEKNMKKRILAFIFIVFAAGCATNDKPKQTSTLASPMKPAATATSKTTFEPGKGVLIEGSTTVSASVISVDKENRSITVRDPEGNISEIDLTEDVKNFDQIHPGDKLILEVYSALAMKLAAPGEEFEDQQSQMVAVAKPGEKPKLVNVNVVEVLAEITAIDKKARKVTVRGPGGNSVTIQVPKDIEKFDELKLGDKVNARYIHAFAVSVQKAD